MDEDSMRPTVTERARAFRLSRRGVLLGAGTAAAGMAAAGLWHPISAHAAPEEANAAVLKFHTMAPVIGEYVGSTGATIRGLHGGGFPWALESAEGELSTDGRLRVRVRGLVLAAGPHAGTNPIATFRAIVSYEGMAPIFTEPVPASSTGDARIDTHIQVPHPGFAPIIFVGPGTAPVWFAVTGAL